MGNIITSYYSSSLSSSSLSLLFTSSSSGDGYHHVLYWRLSGEEERTAGVFPCYLQVSVRIWVWEQAPHISIQGQWWVNLGVVMESWPLGDGRGEVTGTHISVGACGWICSICVCVWVNILFLCFCLFCLCACAGLHEMWKKTTQLYEVLSLNNITFLDKSCLYCLYCCTKC